MGLYIYGKTSKKKYSYSYSALHQVRYLALITCGIPEKVCGKDSFLLYSQFFFMPNQITGSLADEMRRYISAIQISGYYFPNLMLHSDCDGNYTKNGRIMSDPEWSKGNSKQLLKELKRLEESLEDKYKQGFNWQIFNDLFDLVKDEVENGKGHLVFS